MSLIDTLSERRDALQTELDALVATAESETRDLSDEENVTFAEKLAEAKTLDERIDTLTEAADRSTKAAEARVKLSVGDGVVRSEPQTYGRMSGRSYFLDLGRAQVQGDSEARGRLDRHAREIEVESRTSTNPILAELRANPNRTDGQGGYFVPPIWLVDQYLPLARAARVTADLVRNLPLPGGTDSINIPKVSTGTATAVQVSDNTGVQSTDLTDTSIAVPVRTIAGQQDIAMQLLDQSPISFDEVVMMDLAADYATRLDVQVLNGSGSSGQATGILNVSSIGNVNYTTASPAVASTTAANSFYGKLANAIQTVHTTRYLPPTAIVMHPIRWAWILNGLDTSARPLVTPFANNFNDVADQNGVRSQGPVGQMQGLPVYVDPSVPTNLTVGGGSGEDIVMVLRESDLYLWEGSPRTRVLPEVLSGTLQVRVQLYNYFAFTGARYAASICTVSGTGLAAPTF